MLMPVKEDEKVCMCTGAREVVRDLHSPLWKTGMCWSHLLGQNIFVEIWPEYLSTSAKSGKMSIRSAQGWTHCQSIRSDEGGVRIQV